MPRLDSPLVDFGISREERRSRPLIPNSVPTWQLPDPLINDDGEPQTVGEAAETYLRINQHNRNEENRTSRYEIARRRHYPRLLDADRMFQDSMDALTTALFVRMVSPFDGSGAILTPWEIEGLLCDSDLRTSVRQTIDYHLGGFDYEWAAVTTPTETGGTPYELMLIWIDDPDNEVRVDNLEPAMRRHLERCPIAHPEHHEYSEDGSGAIQIEHDPETVDEPPEQFTSIFAESDHTPYPPTIGALYIATQLPDLVVGDFYDPDRSFQGESEETLVEGAAIGWATPHHWVRYSSGVPSI